MARLSTHILDTARGKPGRGIGVKLFSLQGDRHLIASVTTNDDGRTDLPLLDDETFRPGRYELEFAVGAYYQDSGMSLDEPPFLDDVVVRFSVQEDQNYHVPLLVTPWGYSTYRGS